MYNRFIKLLGCFSVFLSISCTSNPINMFKNEVTLTPTAIGQINGVNLTLSGIGHIKVKNAIGINCKVDCIHLYFNKKNSVADITATEGTVFEVGDQKWEVISIERQHPPKKGKILLVQKF